MPENETTSEGRKDRKMKSRDLAAAVVNISEPKATKNSRRGGGGKVEANFQSGRRENDRLMSASLCAKLETQS